MQALCRLSSGSIKTHELKNKHAIPVTIELQYEDTTITPQFQFKRENLRVSHDILPVTPIGNVSSLLCLLSVACFERLARARLNKLPNRKFQASLPPPFFSCRFLSLSTLPYLWKPAYMYVLIRHIYVLILRQEICLLYVLSHRAQQTREAVRAVECRSPCPPPTSFLKKKKKYCSVLRKKKYPSKKKRDSCVNIRKTNLLRWSYSRETTCCKGGKKNSQIHSSTREKRDTSI